MDLDRLGRRWEQGLARQQTTSLSRSIDPRAASNLTALGLALLAGTAAFAVRLLGGAGILTTLGDAFGAGLSVFLAWALGRELDPDDDATALLAGSLTFASWFWWPSSPGILLAVVTAARLTARTTGRPPRHADLIFVVLLGTYVAAQEAGAAATAGLAAALAANRGLGGDDHPLSPFAAAALLVTGGTSAAMAGSIGTWHQLEPGTVAVLAAGILSLPFLGLSSVHSRADYTGEPLDPRRTRAARWCVAATALGGFALAGGLGVSRLAGVWAALVAAAVTKTVRGARR